MVDARNLKLACTCKTNAKNDFVHGKIHCTRYANPKERSKTEGREKERKKERKIGRKKEGNK
jgi:hypothetical protein